jgi:peptide/nickel transport system permease protein
MTTAEAAVVDTPAAEPAAPRRRRVLRRLLRAPLALTGLVVLVVAVLVALFAPVLAPYSPEQTSFSATFLPPGSAGHLLGTDSLGRDVLSRIIYGTRASLVVGVLSVLLALVVGVPLGLLAGYFGKLDSVISRLTDLVLAFPFLILAVGLAAIRGASLSNAALAIGIAQVPGMIRVTRSETLRLKGLDYVSAAVAEGASDLWIMSRHILPNAVSVLIVQATIAIPAAILGEAVLSFLGLGIQPPAPSLGTMLSEAQRYIARAPWTAIIPGLAIIVLTLAFNLFGDGLRDALDPKASRR